MENLSAHIQVIVSEPSKAFHSKEIDADNEKGYVKAYKCLVEFLSSFALEFNSNFEFFHVLVSTVIEGAHNQRFSAHLPSLTNVEKGENNIVRFYKNFVLKTIQ
jgi:hypothetical protein